MKLQFFWLLTARIVATFLGAVAFVIFTRYASLGEVAVLGVTLGVGVFMATLLDLGLTNQISKNAALARDRELVASLGANFAITVIASLSIGIVLLVATTISSLPLALVPLTISTLLEKNVDATLSVSIADGRKWPPSVVALQRKGVLLGGLALLIACGLDPLGSYALASLAGNTVCALYISVIIKRRTHSNVRPSMRASLREIGKARPFFIANVSAQVRQLDSALVGVASESATAGLYTAAARLVNPFLLIPSTMAAVILPAATRITSGQAKRISLQLTALFTAGSLASFAFIPLISQLVPQILGSVYEASIHTFVALVVGLPIVALTSPLGSILQGQGYETFVAKNGVLFALATIIAVPTGAILANSVGAAIAIGLVYLAKATCLQIALLRIQEEK